MRTRRVRFGRSDSGATQFLAAVMLVGLTVTGSATMYVWFVQPEPGDATPNGNLQRKDSPCGNDIFFPSTMDFGWEVTEIRIDGADVWTIGAHGNRVQNSEWNGESLEVGGTISAGQRIRAWASGGTPSLSVTNIQRGTMVSQVDLDSSAADTMPPNIFLTGSAGAFANGTSKDSGCSGTVTVTVAVSDGTNYWGGTAFDSPDPVDLPAGTGDTWSLDAETLLIPTGDYILEVTATDGAGNSDTLNTDAVTLTTSIPAVNTPSPTSTSYAMEFPGTFTEVFVAEGRIGNVASGVSTHELDASVSTAGPFAAGETDDHAWASATSSAFTVTYVPGSGAVTLTIGGTTVTHTTAADPASLIDVVIRGQASKGSLSLTNLMLDGTLLDDIFADSADSDIVTMRIGADGALADGFTLTGDATMTWSNPKPKNSELAFQVMIGEVTVEPDMSDKVTICHAPPGNPANAHSIVVGSSSLAAHLGHGDTQGACP